LTKSENTGRVERHVISQVYGTGSIGAGIASVVLVALFVLLQARETPEQIAAKVAREWTSESIDRISDAIAQPVTGGIPGLSAIASSVISSQIRQRITWEYSEPRESGDLYEVIATASAPIEVNILIIQKRYTVSLSFRLLIDTKAKRVDSWTPDLKSFKFTEG